MLRNSLRTQIAWQSLLITAADLLNGCSEPQKNQAAFCLAWLPACAAAVPLSLVPHQTPGPDDPECTHQVPASLPDHSIQSPGVALIDINALPWFGLGPNGEQRDGPGYFDVVAIGGVLFRSHFDYFELKAPADYAEKAVDRSYSKLAQGRHPNYLRVSIQPWGSPGCELYEREIKKPQQKQYMQAIGMKADQCIAVQDAESPNSRYGFDISGGGTPDYRFQVREIVDLSNNKIYARYNRMWYPKEDCPLPQVREQFMQLIHPEPASNPQR